MTTGKTRQTARVRPKHIMLVYRGPFIHATVQTVDNTYEIKRITIRIST